MSKVFRVGGAVTNPGGRDVNIRFCEQKTAGGGWTVSHVYFNSSKKVSATLIIATYSVFTTREVTALW